MSRNKRMLAMLITVAMVWSLIPMNSFAYADDVPSQDEQTANEVISGEEALDDEQEQGPDQALDNSDDSLDANTGENSPSEEMTDDVDNTPAQLEDDEQEAAPADDSTDEPEDAPALDEKDDTSKKEVPADTNKTETSKKTDDKEAELQLMASTDVPGLSVQAHVQNVGWQKAVTSGKTAGTSGRALRVEGLKINVTGKKGSIPAGSIVYRTHVQNIGWQDWVKDGALAGTTGRALRIEAIQIYLTGELADQYDVYYQVHTQNVGWMSLAENGEVTGTSGNALRLEALRVWLVKKGDPAPSSSADTSKTFIGVSGFNVQSHVQNIGWQNPVGNGKVSGTTGRALRVEAFRASIADDYIDGSIVSGDILYRAHVQNIGWQGWRKNGETAGTTGRELRVEAIEMKLSGELAAKYDLYYRVHVSNIGWLSWAKEGETAGSTGMAQRVEAIQVKLVKDGAAAPSSSDAAYNGPCIRSATIQYAVKVQGQSSWQGYKKNGQTAGTTGKGLRIEGLRAKVSGESGSVLYEFGVENVVDNGWVASNAVKDGADCLSKGKRVEIVRIKLTGTVSQTYDVWYRAHVQNLGWSGWGRNGASVGSKGLAYRIEAIEVRLVPKGGDAPGSTIMPCFDKNATHFDLYKKAQGYGSATDYLIVVDTNDCWVGVFTGSRNNWNVKYYWRCTVGSYATPTVTGVFTTSTSSLHFGEEHGYTCWYATSFYGDYLFHSVKYQPGSMTEYADGRLGKHLSQGCVRLALENAKWIYYNIPDGTTVVVY